TEPEPAIAPVEAHSSWTRERNRPGSRESVCAPYMIATRASRGSITTTKAISPSWSNEGISNDQDHLTRVPVGNHAAYPRSGARRQLGRDRIKGPAPQRHRDGHGRADLRGAGHLDDADEGRSARLGWQALRGARRAAGGAARRARSLPRVSAA